MKRKRYRQPAPAALLFRAWCDAADEWRQLRSDPAEARVRVARAAWYEAVYGTVPPLKVAA